MRLTAAPVQHCAKEKRHLLSLEGPCGSIWPMADVLTCCHFAIYSNKFRSFCDFVKITGLRNVLKYYWGPLLASAVVL